MKNVLMALLAGLAVATPALAQDSGSPLGTWNTANGDAQVRIAPCGGGLCGRIVGLKNPRDEDGQALRDDKNPDPARRNNPIIGTTILISMAPAGPGTWKGRIYNAEDGGMYDGTLQLAGPSALRVQGCLAAFCGGETWSRIGDAPSEKARKKR